LQTLRHAPQFALSDVVAVSQPLAVMPSQLLNPDAQLSSVQAPDAHTAVALGSEHAMLQPPQLAVELVVLTSQPSAALSLQSSKPVEQRVWHAPDTHVAVAFVPAWQALLQRPQCEVEVRRSVSQPLVVLPSQSLKPGLHASPQRPIAHVGMEFGPDGQRIPHDPQFTGSALVLVSHPSAAFVLQSPKPVSHAATPHAPEAQRGVALVGSHTLLQRPQCVVSDDVVTQRPPQHEVPFMQAIPHMPQFIPSLCVSVQRPLQHDWPAAQVIALEHAAPALSDASPASETSGGGTSGEASSRGTSSGGP
jgi:hypothetical protein